MLRITSCLLACLLAAAAASAEKSAVEPYDAKPFLPGLAVHYQKKLRSRMGVSSLSDLPLYQMEIRLNALLGALDTHQELLYKNTTGSELADLVLRTYPNAANLCRDGQRNLEIRKVTVNGEPATVATVGPTALRISLPAPLASGARVRVAVDYRAVVPRLPPGADRIPTGMQDVMQQLHSKQSQHGYGVYATSGGIFNLGFFYPVLPARVGEDWDTAEPAGMGDVAHFDVANYLVKLTVPGNMVVASSGVQVGEQALGSGPADMKEVFLLGTALRHFALQLSTRYVVSEKKAGRIKVRYYHVEENAGSARKTLDQAVTALRLMEKLLGPYPYPQLSVAEAPLVGGAGGMEYPGLVTVAMALTGAGSDGSPTGALLQQLMRSTGTTEFVLAHEIAHQWFHALVGSDSNRHPFMDESLAQYVAVLAFEGSSGHQAAARQMELQLTLPYQMYRLMGGADGRVDRPVEAFGSQLEYAALVYGKGAMFFHALRQATGRKPFVRFLRRYVRQYAFRQAQPEDLVRVAAKATGKQRLVSRLYRRWIEETHGDEDIGSLDTTSLSKVLSQLSSMKGIHNIKLDGKLDPATLRMFQQAIQQMTGKNP